MGRRSWHSPRLLRLAEAAPLRWGGSRCRGLAFRTVKVAPRIVRRRLGKYAQAWLGLLNAKGATSAVVGAQLCPQGPAYMQSVMAAALGGSDNPHARWHAWRRGGSAALRWMGLPINWLAWWGRWLSETVAVHYADAPDDFVVTSEAVLPWPSDDPTGEFVWRAVSLRDVFPQELLKLYAPDADEPPKWGDDGDGSAVGRGGSCPGESASSATAGAAGGEDRAGARDPGAPPALAVGTGERVFPPHVPLEHDHVCHTTVKWRRMDATAGHPNSPPTAPTGTEPSSRGTSSPIPTANAEHSRHKADFLPVHQQFYGLGHICDDAE